MFEHRGVDEVIGNYAQEDLPSDSHFAFGRVNNVGYLCSSAGSQEGEGARTKRTGPKKAAPDRCSLGTC